MMKKIMERIAAPVFATLVSILPSVTHAQISPGPEVPGTNIRDIGDIVGQNRGSLICTVFAWFFWLLIVLAVIFVLVAAFRYLTAAGDPEKVKKANYALIYAVVAVVIALLARAVPNIVFSFLGAADQTICS